MIGQRTPGEATKEIYLIKIIMYFGKIAMGVNHAHGYLFSKKIILKCSLIKDF